MFDFTSAELALMSVGQLEQYTSMMADKMAYDAEDSLFEFYRTIVWPAVEGDRPFVDNWHLRAMAEHLEAVTAGKIRRLLINVPFRTSKPVHVDEPVLTRGGFKRLGEILVGDEVLTHKGRFRRVTAVHEQGTIPTVNVLTNAGRRVRAAPDHPFLTTKGWVNAVDLKGLYVGFPHRHEPLTNSSGMSVEEARLLGYLIGDGCLTQNQTFTNMDRECLDDFHLCAKAVGFFTNEVVHPNPKVQAKKIVLKSAQVRWNGPKGKAPVPEWLRSHGLFQSSSYTKRIPEGVLNGGEEVMRNFLGAYWTCDGHVSVRNKNHRTSMIASATTVSVGLADDLLRLMAAININARVRVHKTKLVTKSQPGGVYTSYNIHTYERHEVEKFVDLPGLLKRKSDIAKAGVCDQFDPMIYSDEVLDVVEDWAGECRCLTVDEDESFTVNGLIVHNSTLVSVAWPAWVWIKNPGFQWLCGSYAEKLAIRDSLKMRRVITSPLFLKYWGDRFSMSGDQNAKERFTNDRNGYRIAFGMTGSAMGDGASTIILDDPQDRNGANSEAERETAITTYNEAIVTRLNNPATDAIVLIMQRLHQSDLSGHVLKQGGWDHLVFPMRFESNRRASTSIGFKDPRTIEGELLWPERFPEKTVADLETILGTYGTAGQLAQRPAPLGGGIMRTDHFRLWPHDKMLPDFVHITQSIDTAFTQKTTGDPTGCCVWGIFEFEKQMHVMLLDCWNENLAYPQLKQRLVDDWSARYGGMKDNVMKPSRRADVMLVENKGSGISILGDLRQSNIPAVPYNPGRADKISRASMAAPFLENDIFWVLESPKNKGKPRSWVKPYFEQLEQFPNGSHDEMVDCTTQFVLYARDAGLLNLPVLFPEDVEVDNEVELRKRQHRVNPYG